MHSFYVRPRPVLSHFRYVQRRCERNPLYTADRALETAEEHDHYIGSLTGVNAVACAGEQYRAVDQRVRDAGAVTAAWPIQPWLMSLLQPACVLVTLHPSAAKARPHTRYPNVICAPGSLPDDTKTHERIHVSQKQYPCEWARALTVWGYHRCYVARPFPERLNPDTLDVYDRHHRFVWFDRGASPVQAWLPVCEFRTPARPRDSGPGGTVVRWYAYPELSVVRDQPPAAWMTAFGQWQHGGAEHPLELSAYALASEGAHPSRIVMVLLRALQNEFSESPSPTPPRPPPSVTGI